MFMYNHFIKYNNWLNLKVKDGTQRIHCNEIRHLILLLGNPEVSQVTINGIVDVMNNMLKIGFDRNGFIGRVGAYRSFFHFIGRDDIASRIPYIQKEYREKPIFDEADYEKLISTFPNKTYMDIRNKALIMFLHDTMCRLGEALSVKITDTDYEHKTATIKNEKNRGTRPVKPVFWTDETNEALRKWENLRYTTFVYKKLNDNDKFLFCSFDERHPGNPLTPTGVRAILHTVCKKVDVPYINPHAFRHAGAHRLVKAGASAIDVQSILGHANIASVQSYTKFAPVEVEERYRKFLDNSDKKTKMVEYEENGSTKGVEKKQPSYKITQLQPQEMDLG